MISKKLAIEVLNEALATGADFAPKPMHVKTMSDSEYHHLSFQSISLKNNSPKARS